MKTLTTVTKRQEYRHIIIGTSLLIISAHLIFDGVVKIGKKFGAEQIIQIAEDMQPGFRDTLKAFIKEKY